MLGSGICVFTDLYVIFSICCKDVGQERRASWTSAVTPLLSLVQPRLQPESFRSVDWRAQALVSIAAVYRGHVTQVEALEDGGVLPWGLLPWGLLPTDPSFYLRTKCRRQ